MVNGNELKKDDYLVIHSELSDEGITLSVKGKTYKIEYPKEVWARYPLRNRKVIQDNLAFMQTCHLPASHGLKGAMYNTAMPLFESFAFKSTMYDTPSTAVIDHEKTTDYLRRFFNSEFTFFSYDTAFPRNRKKRALLKKNKTAIIPFTAGKESLLTFALCMELGIKPLLVYMDESPGGPESSHKYRIIEDLEKEYGLTVYRIVNEPGKLRYCDLGETDNNWGAGTQFLTYLLALMPFARYFNADYIFFGNEYSCDDYTFDKEGFKSNFCFDQCSEWTKQLNAVAKIMTRNSVEVGSLVSPLYELGLTMVLHERYPELARLQMSCFSDTKEGKEHLWCGNCSKCARLFVFFKGLGIDTDKAGFRVNMFNKPSMKHFSLFGPGWAYSYDISGLGQEEQALAFYLAAERGEKGYLIDKFRKTKMYREIRDNFSDVYHKYFTQYETVTTPHELRGKLKHIFDETFSGRFEAKDFRVMK